MTTTSEMQVVRTAIELMQDHFSRYTSAGQGYPNASLAELVKYLFEFKHSYLIQIVDKDIGEYLNEIWDTLHKERAALAYVLDALFYTNVHFTEEQWKILVNQLADGWSSLEHRCDVDIRTEQLAISSEDALDALRSNNWLVILMLTRMFTWELTVN